MSFKIPTLEEARKKREESTIIPISARQHARQNGSPNQATNATNPYKRPLTASTTDFVHPPINSPLKEEKISRKSRSNPYSKKDANLVSEIKPTTSLKDKTYTDSKEVRNPYMRKHSLEKDSSPLDHAQKRQQQSTESPLGATKSSIYHSPEIVNYGPTATFSQAFESIEDTTHYEQEVQRLQEQGDTIVKTNTDRIHQRAIDTANAESTLSCTDDLNGDNVPVTARDQQAHLQVHVLHVSKRQQGNPVLRHIRNVPIQISKIIPDYIMGPNRCAFFLSLRYHSLHPDYIHRRIAEVGHDFQLRVLLVRVDVDDNAEAILVINKLAVLNDLTLILAWSDQEAARYLETFKVYESKDASSIQKREKETFVDQASEVFGAIRSVNKTDVSQLLAQFSTIRGLIVANMDELSLVPGVGEKKMRRIYETFHKPFSSEASRRRKEQKANTLECNFLPAEFADKIEQEEGKITQPQTEI